MAVSSADKKKLGKWIKQAFSATVSTGCRYYKRFSQLD